MSTQESRQRTSVDELRREFDRSFQEARASSDGQRLRLVCIRVGRQQLAFRIGEVHSVTLGSVITAVPGGASGLSGLMASRGRLVAVYPLAWWLRLSGEESVDLGKSGDGAEVTFGESEASSTLGLRAANAGCVARCALDDSLGLSFPGIERILDVQEREIHPVADSDRVWRHVPDVARTALGAYPIISIASVVQAVHQQNRGGALPSHRA